MLERPEALLVLELILDNLGSNWPGEHPITLLDLLDLQGWDDYPEQQISQLQRIGKKLVTEHCLDSEFT